MPTGQVFATTAGDLPARFVIHAVGPTRHGCGEGEIDLLVSAYRNAIARAAELDCASVALPSIFTGIYGFPIKRAAPVVLAAVDEALGEHSAVHYARFCLFSEKDNVAFVSAAESAGIAVTPIDVDCDRIRPPPNARCSHDAA